MGPDGAWYVSSFGKFGVKGDGAVYQVVPEKGTREIFKRPRGSLWPDFGWPYCYYDSTATGLVLAPEYGGDGKKVGECASKREPVAIFPAHWAPQRAGFL